MRAGPGRVAGAPRGCQAVGVAVTSAPAPLPAPPAVPFDEDDKDDSVWFLDHDYLENMYGMFKKVNGEPPRAGPGGGGAAEGLHALLRAGGGGLGRRPTRLPPPGHLPLEPRQQPDSQPWDPPPWEAPSLPPSFPTCWGAWRGSWAGPRQPPLTQGLTSLPPLWAPPPLFQPGKGSWAGTTPAPSCTRTTLPSMSS